MSEQNNIPQQPLTPEELLAWAENEIAKEDKATIDDPFLEDAAEGVRLMDNPDQLISKTGALNQHIQQMAGTAPAAGTGILQLLTNTKFVAVAASVCILLVAGFLFRNVLNNTVTESASAPTKADQYLADDFNTQGAERKYKAEGSSENDKKKESPEKDKEIETPVTKQNTTSELALDHKGKHLKELPEAEPSLKANKTVQKDAVKTDGDIDLELLEEAPIVEEKVAVIKAEEMEKAEEEIEEESSTPMFGASADDVEDAAAESFLLEKKRTKEKRKKAEGKKKNGASDYPSKRKDDDLLPLHFTGDTTFTVSASGSAFQVDNYQSLKLDAQQNKAYNKGIAYFNVQEYDKANRQFDMVLRDLPNSQEVNFQQGLTYLQQNKLKKAQKSFMKVAIAQTSQVYKGYNLKNLIQLLQNKDANGARKLLREASGN